MTNSGLRDVLEMIYGDYAVTHVLNGNSYARSSRGLIRVESMLTRLLNRKTYSTTPPPPTPPSDDDILNPDNTVICEMEQEVENTQNRFSRFRHH